MGKPMINPNGEKYKSFCLVLSLICFIGYILMASTEWYRLETETGLCLFHYVPPEKNYLLLLLSSLLLSTNSIIVHYLAFYFSLRVTCEIILFWSNIVFIEEKLQLYRLVEFIVSLSTRPSLNLVQVFLYFIELLLAPTIFIFAAFNIGYQLYGLYKNRKFDCKLSS